MSSAPADGEGGPVPTPPARESLRRGLSRDALIYAGGDVATKALGFVALPIYTRVFTPAEFSIFVLVTTMSAFLSGLMALGGDTAMSRFWFEDESLDAQRRLVRTWIGFLALWATALCLLMLPATGAVAAFALEDGDRAPYFMVMLAVLPISLTSRMLAQILRNQFRPAGYAITSSAIGVLSLVIGLVGVLAFDLGVMGILIGILTAETLLLAVRAGLTRRLLVGGQWDRQLLSRVLRYGIPLVPVTVSFWVFTASDRIVLGKLGGLTELGYYSLAVSLVSVFALITGAVGQAWVPRVFRLYEQDRDRASAVVGATLTYYVFALGLLAVAISALAPALVALIADPAYAPASGVVPLLTLGAVAYGSNLITASGMTLTHQTGRLAVLSAVAAVVNVVCAVALVPPFGMYGAALAGVLGYLSLTLSYLLVSQRLWQMRLEPRRLVAVVASLAGTLALLSGDGEMPWAVRLAAPLGYVALAVILGGLSPLDRSLVGGVTARVRRR